MTPKLLGTDHNGYTYWQYPDHYVYQKRNDGTTIGWLCTMTAWESSMRDAMLGRTLERRQPSMNLAPAKPQPSAPLIIGRRPDTDGEEPACDDHPNCYPSFT